jgi:hypothetical protein
MQNEKLLKFLILADKICRRCKETLKAQLTEYSWRVWLEMYCNRRENREFGVKQWGRKFPQWVCEARKPRGVRGPPKVQNTRLGFIYFFIFGLYSVRLWEGSIPRNPGLTLLIITGFWEIVLSREPRTAYLQQWNKLIDNLNPLKPNKNWKYFSTQCYLIS